MRRRASSRINPHRFIMTAIAFSFVEQAAIGAGLGVAEFLFCTTCQKTCMLAGMQFGEIVAGIGSVSGSFYGITRARPTSAIFFLNT